MFLTFPNFVTPSDTLTGKRLNCHITYANYVVTHLQLKLKLNARGEREFTIGSDHSEFSLSPTQTIIRLFDRDDCVITTASDHSDTNCFGYDRSSLTAAITHTFCLSAASLLTSFLALVSKLSEKKLCLFHICNCFIVHQNRIECNNLL